MILHTVSHSPFASEQLSQCLARLGAQDGLLLLQEALYALHLPANSPNHALLTQLSKHGQVFALGDELSALGLSAPTWLKVIDYSEFVRLSLEFNKVLSWS